MALPRRVPLPLVFLGLASGAVALVGRANLAPLMSGDSDEPVYVYQARMLAQGHVTLAARVHAQFFHPWLFGQRDSRLFSQYQPGWPSVIALAHLLGDERVSLVIAAVAAVAATWFLGEQVATGSGVFAAALLLISPIFVVHAGLYLSYLWTAALVTGALACVVGGVWTARPAPFLVFGALLGCALLTRPLDAFIAGVAATVYAVVALFGDGRGLRRAGLWAAVGAWPFLLLTAVYNAHVTGSPVRFPLQAAERLDTFGFGNRTMALGVPPTNYTLHLAASSLIKNVVSMPHWFAGGGIGMLLALAAVVLHRRSRDTWLLVAAAAGFPIGYFFWWATALAAHGAARGLGPHYYISAFPFLAVLAGWALHDLAGRSRALVGLGLGAVLVGSSFMVPTILDNAHLTAGLQRAAAGPLIAPSLTNAVVVMRADPSSYMLNDFPFLVGDPRLRGRILYATDRGPASGQLAQLFPNRKLYQFIQQTEPGHPLLQPSYIVEPMRVVTGSTVSMHFNTTNAGRWPVVVASVSMDGRMIATQTLDRGSRRGATSSFDVVLCASAAHLPAPRRDVLVAVVAADQQVDVDVAFGPDERRGYLTDIYERRYYVSPLGTVIAVQTPGLQYHRFDMGHVVWARQNVAEQLAERP